MKDYRRLCFVVVLIILGQLMSFGLFTRLSSVAIAYDENNKQPLFAFERLARKQMKERIPSLFDDETIIEVDSLRQMIDRFLASNDLLKSNISHCFPKEMHQI